MSKELLACFQDIATLFHQIDTQASRSILSASIERLKLAKMALSLNGLKEKHGYCNTVS